jgi:hypothetical protein
VSFNDVVILKFVCLTTEDGSRHMYLYINLSIYTYKKVKFTLEQALKTQKGSRGIALLFL